MKTQLGMDHSSSSRRLKKVRGQVDGLLKMIDEHRYCPEILIQIKAVTKALQAVEIEIMQRHIRGCVQNAIASNNKKEVLEKIDEVLSLVKK